MSVTTPETALRLRLLFALYDASKSDVARTVNIDPTLLSHYLAGRRPVPFELAKQLEAAIVGAEVIEHIQRLLDAAPPFDDEQVRALRTVFTRANEAVQR